MVIDETLAEDPELVRAAASATLLAVENGDLEGELRASRARILEAGHAERRRIERDLHDSTQQRLDLAAAPPRRSRASRSTDAEERAMLERLGAEVDDAIEELRDRRARDLPAGARRPRRRRRAEGGRPQLGDPDPHRRRLARPPVRGGRDDGLLLLPGVPAERGQARRARACPSTVRLARGRRPRSFTVEDDGAGFDPATAERGAGLTNLADRVAAVGGTLVIDARPGRGTRITGEIPAGG